MLRKADVRLEERRIELVALKSAILGLYLEAGPAAHLAARALSHPDELPPGSEGVSPRVHASWWRAPPFAAAAPLCPRCRGLTGGGSDGQSVEI